MAASELAFGPATVTFFGAVIPILPAAAGLLSVILARLIAPKQQRHFTKAQNAALVGLLMIVELSVLTRWPTKFHEPEATVLGLMLGWMGLLIPERVAKIVWDGFKTMLLQSLHAQQLPTEGEKRLSNLTLEERQAMARKIFAKIYPTEAVPEDLDAILDRLRQL